VKLQNDPIYNICCCYYFSIVLVFSVVSYFNRHILRLGGFHSLFCFLSSIGKRWADGGLRDILVDSGVYAGNTAGPTFPYRR
jgi:hypothetical protein